MNNRLDKAREERLRAKEVHDILRSIIRRAKLTRKDMLHIMKSLPGIHQNHIHYISTAPAPDYSSGFEDLFILTLDSVANHSRNHEEMP
jgi:hypothetical protein